jgi:uncharacterized protein (TIGR02145 family)/prepilin-type N-terminal cleavage/methylation domain-containing protein
MTNFSKQKKSAFTLIELLVVIAIIGILSTLAVVALQNARSKARDSKRIADVKQIQTALELYFNDNGSYPTSVTSTIATSGIVYIASVPTAPTPADGSCSTTTNAYTYTSNGSTYTISFCLGSQTSNLPAGQKIATRDGVSHYTPPLPNACNDQTYFVDSRDGTTYLIRAIGNQCWMAENLKYTTGSGWRYLDDEYAAIPFQKMYTQAAALTACPSGWHLPSMAEWDTLNTALSADSQYWCGGNSSYTSKSLASKSYWNSYSGVCSTGHTPSTNNVSGFDGLPIGYYMDEISAFIFYGSRAAFWSTFSEFGVYSKIYVLDSADYQLSAVSNRMLDYVPVRCLKN